MTVAALAALLRAARFNFGNERELQQGIAQHLTQSGISFTREHVLSKRDRVDFYVESDKVAIEVKIAGSVTKLFEQVQRYALHDCVSGVVIVAARSKFLDIPPVVSGMPVELVLQRGFL